MHHIDASPECGIAKPQPAHSSRNNPDWRSPNDTDPVYASLNAYSSRWEKHDAYASPADRSQPSQLVCDHLGAQSNFDKHQSNYSELVYASLDVDCSRWEKHYVDASPGCNVVPKSVAAAALTFKQ